MHQKHHNRIGKLLSQMVSLSHHDIDEILTEQRSTRRPFGEIAVSMGLCQTEHVWKAISDQPKVNPMFVDLDTFGVDSQATVHVSSDVAHELGVMPVRTFGDGFVVAVHEENYPHVSKRFAGTKDRVVFVMADRAQIVHALQTYYPTHSILEGAEQEN